jgi:hypothetical protein
MTNVQHKIIQKNAKPFIYIYINKDGHPSTKSAKHVEANVNT